MHTVNVLRRRSISMPMHERRRIWILLFLVPFFVQFASGVPISRKHYLTIFNMTLMASAWCSWNGGENPNRICCVFHLELQLHQWTFLLSVWSAVIVSKRKKHNATQTRLTAFNICFVSRIDIDLCIKFAHMHTHLQCYGRAPPCHILVLRCKDTSHSRA